MGSRLRLSSFAERSGGNPFLVTELARLLADRGVDPEAIRGVVPDRVRVIAGARLSELPGTTRRILSSAAMLGTRFRLDVLAARR
jgi:predicted ATPase